MFDFSHMSLFFYNTSFPWNKETKIIYFEQLICKKKYTNKAVLYSFTLFSTLYYIIFILFYMHYTYISV